MKIAETADDTGLILSSDDGETRIFVAYRGGAWRLTKDGLLGHQTIGTADIYAPRTGTLQRETWAAKHFGFLSDYL